MFLLSVQCPRGVGLLETVFLIAIVLLNSEMQTPRQDNLSSVCVVPCVVCVHLLSIVGHLENTGSKVYSPISERQWENALTACGAHELQHCCNRVPCMSVYAGPRVSVSCYHLYFPSPARVCGSVTPPELANFSKGAVECCNYLHSPAPAREQKIRVSISLSGFSKPVRQCQDCSPSLCEWSSRIVPPIST